MKCSSPSVVVDVDDASMQGHDDIMDMDMDTGGHGSRFSQGINGSSSSSSSSGNSTICYKYCEGIE